MIKLKGPEGCTSCSHDGIIYKIDKKGIFTVPLKASFDLLKFHKFTNISEIVEEKPTNIKVKDVETLKIKEAQTSVIDELDEEVDELDELDELTGKLETSNKKNK